MPNFGFPGKKIIFDFHKETASLHAKLLKLNMLSLYQNANLQNDNLYRGSRNIEITLCILFTLTLNTMKLTKYLLNPSSYSRALWTSCKNIIAFKMK